MCIQGKIPQLRLSWSSSSFLIWDSVSLLLNLVFLVFLKTTYTAAALTTHGCIPQPGLKKCRYQIYIILNRLMECPAPRPNNGPGSKP